MKYLTKSFYSTLGFKILIVPIKKKVLKIKINEWTRATAGRDIEK